MTGLAEVLHPQMRRPRLFWIPIAFLVLTLLATPVYQSLRGGAATTASAEGPQLSLSLERAEWRPGETIRGAVTITAVDAVALRQDDGLLLEVHPTGVPQTPTNRIASTTTSVPVEVANGQTVTIPFELKVELPQGSYVIGAAVVAELRTGDRNTTLRTGTVGAFRIE